MHWFRARGSVATCCGVSVDVRMLCICACGTAAASSQGFAKRPRVAAGEAAAVTGSSTIKLTISAMAELLDAGELGVVISVLRGERAIPWLLVFVRRVAIAVSLAQVMWAVRACIRGETCGCFLGNSMFVCRHRKLGW